MYYKFLKKPGNRIQIMLDNSLEKKIRMDIVQKDYSIITIDAYSYYNGSQLNITLPNSINIDPEFNINNYNVCVFIYPIIKYAPFTNTDISEQNKIFSNINFILSHINSENFLCAAISYINNIPNIIASKKTTNNTYISINSQGLEYDNNNSTTSSSGSIAINTIYPQPNSTILQFLSLVNAQEVSNFLNTMQQTDVNDSEELAIPGALKLCDFGINNLGSNWIECLGQSLSLVSYVNIYNSVKSLINLNFRVLNTGIGFITNITDILGNIEITNANFVRVIDTSLNNQNLYLKYNNNTPLQITQAGYFVLVPLITTFNVGDKAKIVINNSYILRNCKFLEYIGNYSIFVCNDYVSFSTVLNLTITNIDIYGQENYNSVPVEGPINPDYSNTYTSIANAITGIGIQIPDISINGVVQFETLYKYGFILNGDGTFSLPNFPKSLLTNSNQFISLGNNKLLNSDELAFSNTLQLPEDNKSYQNARNLNYNNSYYSDILAINYSDPFPEIYANLNANYANYAFGISTYIFLAPFFDMLALGTTLSADPLTLIIGIALVAAAIAVIAPTLAESEKVKITNYLIFLNFINNNQTTIDVRQQAIQLYRLYVHQ